jgi:hypothetical protein
MEEFRWHALQLQCAVMRSPHPYFKALGNTRNAAMIRCRSSYVYDMRSTPVDAWVYWHGINTRM